MVQFALYRSGTRVLSKRYEKKITSLEIKCHTTLKVTRTLKWTDRVDKTLEERENSSLKNKVFH